MNVIIPFLACIFDSLFALVFAVCISSCRIMLFFCADIFFETSYFN